MGMISLASEQKICVWCFQPIRWVSPPNATGYFVHSMRGDEFIYCIGKNTRAMADKFSTVGDPPVKLEAEDEAGPILRAVIERQEATQALYDSGLLWLINAAILHPRGYALTATTDDDGRVLDLFVQGDGMEPWCYGETKAAATSGKFKTFESDKAYRNFATAEQKREREWSSKLNPLVKNKPAALEGRTPEMVDAEHAEFERAVIQKALARRLEVFQPELCMRFYDPGYPADYKFCYRDKGHSGGHVYSIRRKDADG